MAVPTVFSLIHRFAFARLRRLGVWSLALLALGLASFVSTVVLDVWLAGYVVFPAMDAMQSQNPPSSVEDDGDGGGLVILAFVVFVSIITHVVIFGFAFIVRPDVKTAREIISGKRTYTD